MRTRSEAALIRARNYRLVQADSLFVGVVSAAGTFLPVYLVRLGAPGTAVGLLTSVPALTAFGLAIPFGRWLQTRRDIVPWYSRLRLVAWMSYAAMGIAGAALPRTVAIPVMLAIWAAASLPSTAALVAFPIVMDGAAGPDGRFDLLGRRWAAAGVSTAITVAVAGQALGQLPFPLNFELLMGAISLAGIGSFTLSRRITIPDQPPPAVRVDAPVRQRVRGFTDLVRGHGTFVSYELRALVFTAGIGVATPLLPLFYVREVHAPDSWIGVIGSAQSAGAVIGYLLARRLSRRRTGTRVLLPSMAIASAVPAAISALGWLPAIAGVAFVGGVATAGTQLALFDELMKRIPREHGVTFSSVDQSLQNLGLVVAPSVGGLLAATIGIRYGLVVAAAIAVVGFAMFVLDWRAAATGTERKAPVRPSVLPSRSPGDPPRAR